MRPPNSEAKQLECASYAWRSCKWVRTFAMYAVMVAVSTFAIHWLEHATLVHALRTALVAAIAKTFAANWVSGIFE